MVWSAIAGLGWFYRGGEFIAFGVALMPGILVAMAAKLIGIDLNSNDDFKWIAAVGLVPMFLAGLLLDYVRVRLKVFAVSVLAGIVVAYVLIAIPFFSEARRLGSISAAAHHFDFDQHDRAIAWQVLCTALGLYISIPGAIFGTLGARVVNRAVHDREKSG